MALPWLPSRLHPIPNFEILKSPIGTAHFALSPSVFPLVYTFTLLHKKNVRNGVGYELI
jgi:hypothetical protein